MNDFHFDERRTGRVVASLEEVRLEIEQAVTARVTLAYNVWTKPGTLSPDERKLKIAMQPYMDLAKRMYSLTGTSAIRFAFAHEMVKRICQGYYPTNLALFGIERLDTQATLYEWIIDDATVKAHLENSGNRSTPQDIKVARPGMLQSAAMVPLRMVK